MRGKGEKRRGGEEIGRRREATQPREETKLQAPKLSAAPVFRDQSAAPARENASHPSTWQVVTHWEINPNEIAQMEKSNSH